MTSRRAFASISLVMALAALGPQAQLHAARGQSPAGVAREQPDSRGDSGGSNEDMAAVVDALKYVGSEEGRKAIQAFQDKGASPVTVAAKQPSGTAGLKLIGGPRFSVGQAADDGVLIAVSASPAVVPKTDPNSYRYVVVAGIYDPTGKKIHEQAGSIVVSAKLHPDFGTIMRYKACAAPGDYKIDAVLTGAIVGSAKKPEILDSKTGKFTVYQKP